MALIQRFLTSFRGEDDGRSGLIEKNDATIWYRKPDGSEAEIGNGGSLPFPIETATGVPGFDFPDTYAEFTLYYEFDFDGLYFKTFRAYDVTAAVSARGTDPATLPNLGITPWVRVTGDNNGWPVPGISIDNNGGVHIDAIPGKAAFLSDLVSFESTGNGIFWSTAGGSTGQVDVQVGSSGQHGFTLVDPDGTIGAAPGGIKFPTADPHVAGAWWDNAGTLTKSLG